MACRLTRNSYRIGRRAGQQGPLSPVRNQAGIEKYATGSNSTQQVSQEHQAQGNPQNGLLSTTTVNSTKETRETWTTVECENFMEVF